MIRGADIDETVRFGGREGGGKLEGFFPRGSCPKQNFGTRRRNDGDGRNEATHLTEN